MTYKMKRELTIKDLSAYLPYELKIQGQTHGDIETMTGLNSGAVMINHKTIGWADFFDIKPILRPLSTLTEPIEHEGKILVPNEVLGWDVLRYKRRKSGDYPIIYNETYDVVEKLLEWKFDIFGLIQDNLAIPVTKDFNPYK
jgi:hypothetical protein